MEGGTSVTAIHPELSPKSRYWIDRHRYYELKHFCLQYPLWIRARASLDGLSRRALRLTPPSPTGLVQSPTSRCAEQRLWYTERIAMVEESAAEADPLLGPYLLRGVTEGLSYDCLKARLAFPCSREAYYDSYRKFFWLLSEKRQ
jgi:hypothetical protein